MNIRDARLPILVCVLVASGSAALLIGVPGTLAARSAAAAAGRLQHTAFPAETARAEQAMNELQRALLAKLSAAMTSGGPVAAVEVCRTDARTIAESVAKAQGLELGRTSHRLRSPANAPRAWARPAVDAAAGSKAAAEGLKVFDLGDRVGVLRPIGTAEACTKCHGAPDQVRKNLGAALAGAYPQDRATGFAPGDLRGWMWAEVPKGAR
jgi:hypothetical protein